jgi:hypothetical protein
MRHMRTAAIAIGLIFTFWATTVTNISAAPSCTTRFRFCDNCARQIRVVTKKNQACQIRYRINNGAIFSQRVIKRGSGVYGTTNSTFGAYQPKANFVGNDYFEVEIEYERSGSKFKTTLQADVSVSE